MIDFVLTEAIVKNLLNLTLALVLGGIVGFQREMAGREAGFRTYAMVCVGSALAMIISIEMHRDYGGDAGRIAAQVISGIGFLGAGAILRIGITIRGLTTAAGLWVIACIGLAVGAGLYVSAILATIFCSVIMSLMLRLEKKILEKRKGNLYTLNLFVDETPEVLENLLSRLKLIDPDITFKEVRCTDDAQMELEAILYIQGKNRQGEILSLLQEVDGIKKVVMES